MAGASNSDQHLGPVPGLYYFNDFVSLEEEQNIVELIDSRPFSLVWDIARRHYPWYRDGGLRSRSLPRCRIEHV